MFSRKTALVIAFLGIVSTLAPLPTTSDAAETWVDVLIGPQGFVPEKTAKSDLNTPFAIEFAAGGEMITVELVGGRVLSWHEKNGLRHLAGMGAAGFVDGPAKQAKFNQLHNLAIQDDGTILLSDHHNHSVRKFDPATKQVSTVLGNGEPGPADLSVRAADARFNVPIALALTLDKKSLLIADIGNRCVRRWDMGRDLVTILAGNGASGVPRDGDRAIEAPLIDPRAAIQNERGEIYILERGGHALRLIDAAGIITTVAGTGEPGSKDGEARSAQFNAPKHLCLGPKGTVFIADENNHAVRKYDPANQSLTTVDLGDYTIRRPHGVCVYEDWLYIADSYQHRILRVKL